MTRLARKLSAPRRPAATLLLWIACAAVLAAVPGCGKVEAHADAVARAGLASAEKHAAKALKVEQATVVLPEEYRTIAPAGLNGALPPIPPSETWPAQ